MTIINNKIIKNLYSKFTAALVLLAILINQSEAQVPNSFNDQLDQYLANDKNVEKILSRLREVGMKLQQKEMEERKKMQDENIKSLTKNFNPGHSPVWGNANAKVTIIEFSDFECPYCKKGADTLEEVKKKYNQNDIRVVFKNYPLPFHKNAEPAARAALAANVQGKFWEMYKELFNNQKSLSEEFFIDTAKKIGLDVAKFRADYSSEKIISQVKKDEEEGKKFGVSGTPAFFVNGQLLEGAQPIEEFVKVIDKELKK